MIYNIDDTVYADGIDKRYIRQNVLPDNKFMEMVTDYNKPPEWAIYFGLVKKNPKKRAASVTMIGDSPNIIYE